MKKLIFLPIKLIIFKNDASIFRLNNILILIIKIFKETAKDIVDANTKT